MPGAEFKYVYLRHSVYRVDSDDGCKTSEHTFYKIGNSYPKLAVSDEQRASRKRAISNRKASHRTLGCSYPQSFSRS